MNEKERFYNHVAKRILKYMKLFGMSQTELAKKMNVSNATVSDWVHAKKCPRMDKIDQMADLFCCSRSDIMDPDKPEQNPDDEKIQFIIEVAKTNDGTLERLLAYAQKLRELTDMENE